jgi:CHAD domain-containing protein/CYTH domain-containing protein
VSLVEAGSVTEAGLSAPAGETVPALLAARIADVSAAATRLGQAGDGEALHDFRVAIRRLRSLLRAYRDLADAAIPRRLRRGLRQLARATNLSRDLEVKLAWLQGEGASLRPRERTGARWLAERLDQERTSADAEALALVTTNLTPLAAAVTARLDDLPPSTGVGAIVFARLVADLLREQTYELEQDLGRIKSIENQEEAHEARIAGKRVRYLLEPLALTVPLAAELVARLKGLQDLLGDMHDADVAAHLIATGMEDAGQERGKRVAESLRSARSGLDTTVIRRERRIDPMPGLMALAQKVQARRETAWSTLEQDWLPHVGPRLLDPLNALAQALDRKAPSDVEIERKYLLTALPERVKSETPAEIDQGYVPGEKVHERLRRVASRGGTKWYRTVKLGAGVVRQEIEEQVTEALFLAMWPLTQGRRVTKRRYRVTEGELVWEIDEFTGRDLVLAEVELPNAEVVPRPPDWLAPYVTRDVTEEPAYLNINLAS